MKVILPRRAARWSAGIVVAVFFGGTARADLTFSQPVADAGQVDAGVALAHRFSFVNTGPERVEVTELHGSCGCLKPRIDKNIYEPGEKGEILLEVHTLGQAAGPHRWKVDVTYRSGKTVFVMPLQFTARVVAEVVVQPAAVTIVADQSIQQDVFLTDLRPRALAVTRVQTSTPKLKAALAEQALDPQGHATRRIRLEIPADYSEGRSEEILVLYTDDPKYAELKVPVTIIKRSRNRLAASPPQVVFPPASGTAVVSRMLLIRDSQGEQVVVDEVISANPAVSCQWARGPGAMTTLRVRVDPSRVEGGALESLLQVRVSQPVPATLSIPVTYQGP